MNVTKITSPVGTETEIPEPTNEELQNEYNYLLAEQFTKKLLAAGKITLEEFNKIMEKNRQSFCPFMARIMEGLT